MSLGKSEVVSVLDPSSEERAPAKASKLGSVRAWGTALLIGGLVLTAIWISFLTFGIFELARLML